MPANRTLLEQVTQALFGPLVIGSQAIVGPIVRENGPVGENS